MKMFIIFLLFLCNIFHPLHAQEDPVFAFVISSTLKVRSAPNDTSRIIYILKKNDRIQLLENTYETVPMEEGYDTWYKIRIDSIVGFTLRSNLSGSIVQLNKVDTFDIILNNYFIFNYNPDLNWYGIFSTIKGDLLRKIKIKPLLVGDEIETSGISPFDIGNENYVFAIGTKEKLNQSIIGVKSYLPDIWLKPFVEIDLILYDTLNGFSNGHQLITEWKYVKSKVAERDFFTDYTLYYKNNNQQDKIILYQPDLNYFNQVPTLFWYGDIDHDQLPEFLFKVNGDNRGHYFEFIKVSKSNEKLIMNKLISKRPASNE
ncbi:MAG: SH3 domain-containing protein [Saprospiraceae bacterium]|nr:SH3 domain-containing protein [Saprospiraceae bacterium]